MIADLELARRFLAQKGAASPLVVGVTGAHAYGFPSADSDLDLKGVHEASATALMGLEQPPQTVEVVELFEGREIDYTSHEILGHSLRLLARGNGNLLERILSPLQCVATGCRGAPGPRARRREPDLLPPLPRLPAPGVRCHRAHAGAHGQAVPVRAPRGPHRHPPHADG